ncbi:MAG: polyprenyl synthetase family protein, partial [Anaerolineae bacterium]
LTAVEEEIQTLLAEQDPTLIPFYGMLRYHLGWVDESLQPTKAQGGKRIRPLLCLLVCEALGGDYHLALPAAVAVELVHNFSPIHDDIEDKSPKRRGRATVWQVWGVPQAINAGDGLLALAQLALHRLSTSEKLLTQATRILNRACLDLCEGQYLDIAFQERTDVTLEMYLAMAGKKTASLLECAAHLGAILATRKKRIIEAYRGFARNLGLAFQITDDLLGIWGEEGRTGKGVGEDIKAGKKSLPVVYAFEEERRRGLRRLEEIYGEADLDALLPILEELKVKERCQERARHFQKRALEELERTGIDNRAQGDLRDLALLLVERRF